MKRYLSWKHQKYKFNILYFLVMSTLWFPVIWGLKIIQFAVRDKQSFIYLFSDYDKHEANINIRYINNLQQITR